MKRVLQVLVGLLGALFCGMGLQWAFDPGPAAERLEISLLEGVALSHQIALMGTFFLGSGLMMLYGLVKGKSVWLYPPSLLIILAAVLRVLAWLLQGAPFTTDLILFEVVFAAILVFAARKFERDGPAEESR